MKLVKMNREEFEVWAPRLEKEYAADKVRANGYTEAEAKKIAEDDIQRFLPDGFATKDAYLFTMKVEGENVGFLWLSVRGAADNRKGFIYDVIVEEKFRGQGYGRKAMLLLEDEVKKLGLKEIGLHVFGFNEAAIGLYKSLGYVTTDLVMAKTIK